MAKVLLLNNGIIQELQMGQELTVGRAYSNLLRLEGEEISRVHAIIYRRGNDYILRDLDSKNGVFLNGFKVANSVISPGDEIRVGTYVLLFDPPDGYNMQNFLRRHNLMADDESESASLITSATDEETNSAQSMQAVGVAESQQVFFSIQEIERLAETQHGLFSPQFLGDLMRMHRQLSATSAIDEHDDESAMLQHFLTAGVVACGADRGVLVLKDEANESLRLGAIVPKEKDIAVNRVVLRSVLRKTEAVLCNDAMRDERFLKTDTIAKERIGSLMAYPLMRGDSPYGLIYCDVIDRANAFRREHLLLLHFLAKLLFISLKRSAVARH